MIISHAVTDHLDHVAWLGARILAVPWWKVI
jgi:hypothetical protein